MKSVKAMSDQEFVQHVRLAAKHFAVKTYEKNNPGCTSEAAWAWAERHWKQFKDTALDWIAVCEAHTEAENAAPWN